MKKEKIEKLKSEMRKITESFNLKFIVNCEKCGYKGIKVNYFDYFASVFVTCPQCGRKWTFQDPVILPGFDEFPFYKRKFIDGHFKIIQHLTIDGVDFSQNVIDEQEEFFDYDWDFANGVVDIYTSFEMFLYELTCKKLEKLVNSGKKINKSNPKFEGNSNVLKLVEKINSREIFEANIILEEIEGSFAVKDCRLLLDEIDGFNKKELDSCYYALREIRNGIVHRGRQTNFEDYAKTFIRVGKVLNMYTREAYEQ